MIDSAMVSPMPSWKPSLTPTETAAAGRGSTSSNRCAPSSWCTVLKLSASSSMHILRRRSPRLVMSQALAWQTTSRSRGRTNIERCQKVSGSGSRPNEVKKFSPYFTSACGVVFLRTSAAATSRLRALPAGATSGQTLPQSCAHILPRRCAGIGPLSGTRAPWVWRSFMRGSSAATCCQRLHLLPQPLDIGGEGIGWHIVLGAPQRPTSL